MNKTRKSRVVSVEARGVGGAGPKVLSDGGLFSLEWETLSVSADPCPVLSKWQSRPTNCPEISNRTHCTESGGALGFGRISSTDVFVRP